MCECLEYEDGSFYLCPVDADIMRGLASNGPSPSWLDILKVMRDSRLSAARRVRDWIAAERTWPETTAEEYRAWCRQNLDDPALVRIIGDQDVRGRTETKP